MTLSNARAQFITLPNELLQLICSFVDVCFVFPGEKRDIYAVLAQTNSRLRSFALPCYFNKINIPKFNVRARTKFVQDAGYIDAVRCVSLFIVMIYFNLNLDASGWDQETLLVAHAK